jgi:hypothetical protein
VETSLGKSETGKKLNFFAVEISAKSVESRQTAAISLRHLKKIEGKGGN